MLCTFDGYKITETKFLTTLYITFFTIIFYRAVPNTFLSEVRIGFVTKEYFCKIHRNSRKCVRYSGTVWDINSVQENYSYAGPL